MVNVNINDGVVVSDETYAHIKKDYVENDLPVVDIREKYGLSTSNWSCIRKRIKEDTGFIRPACRVKRDTTSNPSFIHFATLYQKYVVTRQNNGRCVVFGGYKSRADAEKVVERLKECDWDKNQLNNIRKELGV